MEINTINPRVNNDIYLFVSQYFDGLKTDNMHRINKGEKTLNSWEIMMWDFGGNSGDPIYIAKMFIYLTKGKYTVSEEVLYEFILKGADLKDLMNLDLITVESL